MLALAWTAVQGAFTIGNFAVGFGLGYVVLRPLQPLLGDVGYDQRIYHQVALVGFFLKELVWSSVRVATEVLTPGYGMRSGILAVPLSVQTDLGITLFANLISLTPGTLSLDVSEQRKYLYVHFMYVDRGPEEDAQHLKETLERRIILALGEAATERPAPAEMAADERAAEA